MVDTLESANARNVRSHHVDVHASDAAGASDTSMSGEQPSQPQSARFRSKSVRYTGITGLVTDCAAKT